MYQKIRITVVAMAVMLMCIAGSTATLSYFTDTDGGVNNFTVGNASTTLTIYDGDGNILDTRTIAPLEDGTTIPFRLKATTDGNISVYQRFRVVIPLALRDIVTLTLDNTGTCDARTAENNTCSYGDNYTATYNPSVNDTYAEYYIVNNSPLAVNATTAEWPTVQINIGSLSGVDQSVYACDNDNPNACVLGIRAYSDAIQTTGFDNAEKAFSNFTETY